MNNISKLILLLLTIVSLNAYAWMESWEPKFDYKPANFTKLSEEKVQKLISMYAKDSYGAKIYAEGAEIDLNNDGIKDYVIIIPWMGCGLAFYGTDTFFIVSSCDGDKSISSIESFGADLSDLIKINDKIYYKHSDMLGNFENSIHNHWVYQIFSFDKFGFMQRANGDMEKIFPAVTIYYKNPRFKQIELTKADIESIIEQTIPDLHIID